MNLPAPVNSRRSVDPKHLLSWEVSGREYTAPIEAHVRPYVDALGMSDGVRFFLAFGGAPLYLPARPQKRSRLVALVGSEKATALAVALGAGQIRVPIAQSFVIRALRSQNVGTYEIARQVRCTDTTVRKFLRDPTAFEAEAAS